MVWPKSGSITNSDTSVSSSTSAIEVAGISGRPVDSANSHAASTTKAGLADSEAWMLTPSSVIQRREPFTSGPTSSVATISAIEIANTISALRRICRGDRNDTAIITMNDGSRNSTCRLKKWNGSSPIRVATGGLAASDRMTPASISAMIAASCRRSTVHHHSLRGVRCSREIMAIPFGRRARLLVAEDGFQGVNGIVIFWQRPNDRRPPLKRKRGSAFSRLDTPEFLQLTSAQNTEGAGNAGCAVHPRPRVQQKKHTS